MATEIPIWFDYAMYMENRLVWFRKDGYGNSTYKATITEYEAEVGVKDWTMIDILNSFAKEKKYKEGRAGAYIHWKEHGMAEDCSPNMLFSVEYYYKALAIYNKRKAGMADADILANLSTYFDETRASIEASSNAWTHYINTGTGLYINPSPYFNTKAYLEAKAIRANSTASAVAASLKTAKLSALMDCFENAGSELYKVTGEATAWLDGTRLILKKEIAHNDDPTFEWQSWSKSAFKPFIKFTYPTY